MNKPKGLPRQLYTLPGDPRPRAVYFGRGAHGIDPHGRSFAIIAENDEDLAAFWRELSSTIVNPSMVRDAAIISQGDAKALTKCEPEAESE